MLKRIKLQNSTLLLAGIILIVTGLVVGFSDYLKSKKDKAFSEMNILLYNNETPEVIDSDEEIIERQEQAETPEEPVEEPQPQPQPSQQPQSNQNVYNYIGVLEIPKLNLKRGFLELGSRYNNVDYNVTVINGSTFPGEENNNLILAAHSGNCSYCYFDKLYRLSLGDIAYVTYAGIKHSYKIVNIYEVPKTGTVAIHRDYTKNVLTLITCTRNTNNKQSVYILEEY